MALNTLLVAFAIHAITMVNPFWIQSRAVTGGDYSYGLVQYCKSTIIEEKEDETNSNIPDSTQLVTHNQCFMWKAHNEPSDLSFIYNSFLFCFENII